MPSAGSQRADVTRAVVDRVPGGASAMRAPADEMPAADATSVPGTLVIACGAIARELVVVLEANAWRHVAIECLPAEWHNTPERIVPAVERRLIAAIARGQQVFVAYGDCGTGGRLDALLAQHGVERLPGAHCYDFFAGLERLQALATAEPGTFWLTDYLARNFDRLVLQGLGITRHPELRAVYFAHYRRVVWLAQTPEDSQLKMRAIEAAAALELPLEIEITGLEPFTRGLRPIGRLVALRSAPPMPRMRF